MKKIWIALFFTLCFSSIVIAQSSEFGIKFTGFVKTDVMFDSRQTVTAREGHFLLYPAGEDLDVNGEDANAQPNLNMLAIQTRLKGAITGPDAFGAKTSGLIEAAFFGHSNADVNGFRLRHAFLTLAWEKNTLLVGQFWHPMFVTGCFPGTVSFNTGVPFQPFSRNPQVRLTHTTGAISLLAAAVSQRDFTSSGPDGAGSQYLRNAAVPNLHGQLLISADKVLLGAGVDWKMLKPRLKTPLNYVSDETVSGVSVMGFAKFKLPKAEWKIYGVYGQNLTDMVMLSGYAVNSIDAATAQESYIPTDVMSVWTDFSTGTTIAYGCFAAYTQNQGAGENIGSFWGRGSNIDNIYRISPRIMWNSGKTRFAAEVEYTAAAYGTADKQGKVQDAEYVNNLRLLLAAYYFF